MKLPIILISVSLGIFLGSCKKKESVKTGCTDPISIDYDSEADEDDGSCRYAGYGGDFLVQAYPLYNGDTVIGKVGYPDSAFVKFNATSSPGNTASDFDFVIAGLEGDGYVNLGHLLSAGKYYIMITGYDSTINARVTGGKPFELVPHSNFPSLWSALIFVDVHE